MKKGKGNNLIEHLENLDQKDFSNLVDTFSILLSINQRCANKGGETKCKNKKKRQKKNSLEA